MLDLPEDADMPPCPKAEWISLSLAEQADSLETDDTATTGSKRKTIDGEEEANKRSKGQSGAPTYRILTVLDKEDLRPHVPTRQEIERAILQRQKADLLSEYVR